MTPAQIKNIHIAKSKVQLSEEQYRLMLHNVAGVGSSKQLTNESYEDCMALLEDHGYRQILDGVLQPVNYWQKKVESRGTFANGRLIHKIQELWERESHDSPYTLPGLAARASQDRTRDVNKLTPREANNLIEMLKAILERKSHDLPSPSLTENTESTEKLAAANRWAEKNHPLPRCQHGHALNDHSGEALEPPCGCRSENLNVTATPRLCEMGDDE